MSRLPSTRGSSSGAAGRAAAAQRRPGVLVQSAKSDIYVAMLGVSLAAILIATILMTVLFASYGWSTKISQANATPAVTRLA
ncbi:MAG: hypothetical protein ACYC61_32505 [Isosphaeraceae bacterium]